MSNTCLSGYDLPPHDAPCRHCGATVDELCRIELTGDLVGPCSTCAAKDAEIERLRNGLSVIATQSTAEELQAGYVEEVGDYQEGYDALVKHARKILRGEAGEQQERGD